MSAAISPHAPPPDTDSNALPFEPIDPPFWWVAAQRYAIASRHLPDGTRQIVVQGHMPAASIIDNAQVFGAANLGWPAILSFETTQSEGVS